MTLPTKAGRRRLLLVDHDELIRASLSIYFQYHGCQVTAVDTPEKALESLRSGAYEMVLCDRNFPGMSGVEFFSTINRSHPGLRKVLFLDYRSSCDAVTEALNVGADDFIQKPFTVRSLEGVVLRLLDRGGAESKSG
jgi:DNA-binding response OmpR family regulator